MVVTPQLHEQFAASVDDDGVFFIVGCSIDHPEQFDHPFHLIQIAEVIFDGNQHGEAALPGRSLALRFIEVLPQFAGDVGAVGIHRYMARQVQVFAVCEATFVNTLGGRNDGERQAQSGKFFFYHDYMFFHRIFTPAYNTKAAVSQRTCSCLN